MSTSPSLDIVFSEAIELPAPADRVAYIARACGGEARCGSRWSGWSPLTSRPASFLDRPALGRPRRSSTTGPRGPRHGGRAVPAAWSMVGEGGMGVVFVAEQRQPVRRKVALKVIKPGMDTKRGGRPVRGRAAGAGAHGPPEHRQGVRRRGDRPGPARTSSWSWSAACRSPSTATRPGSASGSGWSCSSRCARRCSTPTRRGSSTGTSSRPTCW